MAADLNSRVEFGPFQLDRSSRALRRDGDDVPLPPKAMDLLLVLLESPGTLVTKAELLERVWPDTFVEEGNLPVTIFALRKALGDDGGRYVKTVPRRGYCFAAPVRVADASTPVDALAPIANGQTPRSEVRDAAPSEVAVQSGSIAAPADGTSAIVVGARNGWRYAASLAAAAVLIWVTLPFVTSESVTVEATPVRSLAVAPFAVANADPSDELIGMGLSGDIALRLSSLSELAVRPLASTAKFANQLPADVGRALQVDAVLSGAITSGNNGIHLSAELTRVADGARLWTLSASAEDSELLVAAGRIAAEAAGAAVPGLSSEQRSQLAKQRTASTDSYRSYLAGLAMASEQTVNGARDGLERFEEAIRLDPSFADAHAELATLTLLPLSGSATTARVERARDAAARALALDDRLGHAHGSLAAAAVLSSWDWRRASEEYARAISLSPRDSELRLWHAIHLSALGRHDDALREIDEAITLAPTSARVHFYRGMTLLMARRYDEALAQFRVTPLELGIVQQVYLGMSVANAKKTRYELAHATLDRIGTRIDNAQVKVHRAFVFAEAGAGAEADAMLRGAKDTDDGVRTPHAMFAAAEACAGRMDEAFRHLALARDTGDTRVLFANVDPALDCARTDPRFAGFIASLGLGDRPSAPNAR